MDTSAPTSTVFDPKSEAVQKLLRNFRSTWKMRFFFLQKLPTLLHWRARIEEVSVDRSSVSLPMGWRTQNPFKSIYFAAQAGVGELSTGMLAMLAMAGQPKVSMLVTHLEADFTKKAVSRTTFICEDGPKFQEVIQRAIDTGKPQTFVATTIGRQADGAEVSRIYVTWSFKRKS